MPNALTVLLNILAMFLVILVGWVARRRGYLTAETTGALSRFVVDLTMPALILTQMLKTVTLESLRQDWYLPLLGAAVLGLSFVVGWLTAPVLSDRGERNTFMFLVMVANWVYLPLPIVQALYGDRGVQLLLLSNLGAQLMLWTLGVWSLRGGRPDLSALRELTRNPGLVATAAGIGIALVPGMSLLAQTGAAGGVPLQVGRTLYTAMELVGGLTIPLSLVMTGAQLGELDLADHRPTRTLYGVLLARLALAPLLVVALGVCIAQLGAPIPLEPRMVSYLIACMPVAISCSIFTERFGGSTSLAARTIFYSTLISIATVPLVLWVIQRFGC